MATHNRETAPLVDSASGARQLARTACPVVQRGSTVLLDGSAQFARSSTPTYGRGGLATQAALRRALCELESADDAQLYPSGLAAITGTILALTSAGDEVLAVDSIYNPTRRFLDGTMRRFGVSVRYFAPDTPVDELDQLIGPATRLIMIESPGSLTLDMLDVPAIAALARNRGILTVIDNTFAAGVLFRPLDHGVDVSIQSLTKYVCGHSDVFLGMAAARGEAAALLASGSQEAGWAVSPDDAYMALRGLKTLHTRLARHGASALRVASWLAGQPEITQLLCPALPGAPGHALWARDFNGSCGLVSAVLDSDAAGVDAMLDALTLFGLGYSWGGFESLAIPCDAQLAARAIPVARPGPVVRFHIGLEDTDDLIADLRHGLDALANAERRPGTERIHAAG